MNISDLIKEVKDIIDKIEDINKQLTIIRSEPGVDEATAKAIVDAEEIVSDVVRAAKDLIS